jgi:hypothetical protein
MTADNKNGGHSNSLECLIAISFRQGTYRSESIESNGPIREFGVSSEAKLED